MEDVIGFEGLYAVSKEGRIWSFRLGRFMAQCLNRKGGYWTVVLCKNNIRKRFLVHRLMGQAFLKNPRGHKEINHKNGVKKDNRVGNLEWCSREHNMSHAVKTGLKPSMPALEREAHRRKYNREWMRRYRNQHN